MPAASSGRYRRFDAACPAGRGRRQVRRDFRRLTCRPCPRHAEPDELSGLIPCCRYASRWPRPPTSTQHAVGATRSGLTGTLVFAFAFFDSLCLGAPIALLAVISRPSLVRLRHRRRSSSSSLAAALGRSALGRLVLGQRHAAREEARVDAHSLRWLVRWRGSSGVRTRWYAIAAAVANPILVATLARPSPASRSRSAGVVLGAVAYAIPYVALWTIVGLTLQRNDPRRVGGRWAVLGSNQRPWD